MEETGSRLLQAEHGISCEISERAQTDSARRSDFWLAAHYYTRPGSGFAFIRAVGHVTLVTANRWMVDTGEDPEQASLAWTSLQSDTARVASLGVSWSAASPGCGLLQPGRLLCQGRTPVTCGLSALSYLDRGRRFSRIPRRCASCQGVWLAPSTDPA